MAVQAVRSLGNSRPLSADRHDRCDGESVEAVNHINFGTLKGEMFFADHLRRMSGVRIFDGDTTVGTRREAIRAAIIAGDLQEIAIGVKNGQPETWRQAFERFYSQPLELPETEEQK